MATVSRDPDAATEVRRPTSEREAIEVFGDGKDVLVVGGGTIVLPELTYRQLTPTRALLLKDAGLAGIERDGSRITMGAMTPVEELVDFPAPIGPCARNIADAEIRSQATVGGNICAGEGDEAPRGDLQGAFLAVGATAAPPRAARSPRSRSRSSSRSGVSGSSSPAELRRAGRGRVRGPRPSAHARLHGARRLRRPRRRTGPSASPRPERARTASGSRRPKAATPRRGAGRRRPARRRARVRLVPERRCSRCSFAASSTELEGGRMNLTVNGVAHEVEAARSRRCSTCCATSSVSPARRPAATRAAAAPARCSSTASRGARACCRRLRGRGGDHDGRGARHARAISRRSSRRSSTTTPRSAASARRG